MTGRLKPHMEVLPPVQQRLWPGLRPAAGLGFVLYGGTAIALRLGHRSSVDFDFFSSQPLARGALHSALPFMARSRVLQDQPDTLTVLVSGENNGAPTVKASFFGGIGFGRVGAPEVTEDGVLQVASLDDLMATKVKVMLQRVEAKDYRDVAAMIRAGTSLARGMAAARVLYGDAFQPSESLKALVYFQGGDLATLSNEDRQSLVEAVSAVRALPEVPIVARRLTL